MNVVFVNRFFFPDEVATSRIISSLAVGLANLGWSVDVVTGRRFHNGSRMPRGMDEITGVAVHRIWSSSFGAKGLFGRGLEYLTFHASAWLHIRRLARARSPTVIVACTDPPLLSITAMLAIGRSGAVLVNSIQDLFPEVAIVLGILDARGILARLLCRARDASLYKARWNVALTAPMAAVLRNRGAPESSLAIIHNSWLDGRAIRPVDRKDNALLKGWGLVDKFVIGYSGNLGRVHEFATILDAAERLRERHDFVFLFIGSGHRRDWVEGEARRRGLDNILMKPFPSSEHFAESLSALDLHLVSLLPDFETCSFPSKLYGILAAGRPTLFVGDLDGEIARIITEGSCGLAFAIGDGKGLARRITELAGSEALRHRMGGNARRLFEESFTREIGIEKWHRLLYACVVAGGSQTVPSAPIASARGRVRTTLRAHQIGRDEGKDRSLGNTRVG